jgi:hypothetical protein
MRTKLPRILSPTLGCPFIVSPDNLRQLVVDVAIARSIDPARNTHGLIWTKAISPTGANPSSRQLPQRP